MPRKIKKRKELHTWLIPKLRRVSLYWPEISDVTKRAKVKVQIGHTLKGEPKYKVKYQCECCAKVVDTRAEIEVDHIEPVVNVSGFTTWNDYIPSLFCSSDNLRALCKQCHAEVTQMQQDQRNIHNSNKKKKLDK